MKAHGRKEKEKLHKQHDAKVEKLHTEHDQHVEQSHRAHAQQAEAEQAQDVRMDQQQQSAAANNAAVRGIQQGLPQAVGSRQPDRGGGKHH